MSIQKKLCILGDFAVGKTSLVRRHVLNVFSSDYKATLGVDIYKYREESAVAPGGNTVILDEVFWDIEGSLTLDDKLRAYLHGAAGAVIVGDATRAETVATIPQYAENFHSVQVGRPIVVALNKMDLVEDQNECDDTMATLKKSINAPVFATSAATGDTVKDLFHCLGNRVLELGT